MLFVSTGSHPTLYRDESDHSVRHTTALSPPDWQSLWYLHLIIGWPSGCVGPVQVYSLYKSHVYRQSLLSSSVRASPETRLGILGKKSFRSCYPGRQWTNFIFDRIVLRIQIKKNSKIISIKNNDRLSNTSKIQQILAKSAFRVMITEHSTRDAIPMFMLWTIELRMDSICGVVVLCGDWDSAKYWTGPRGSIALHQSYSTRPNQWGLENIFRWNVCPALIHQSHILNSTAPREKQRPELSQLISYAHTIVHSWKWVGQKIIVIEKYLRCQKIFYCSWGATTGAAPALVMLITLLWSLLI